MSLESEIDQNFDFLYEGGEIHSDKKWLNLEGHTCVVLEDQGKMIVIGGDVKSPQSFIFDFESTKWNSVPSPVALIFHTSVLVRTSSRCYLLVYGGKMERSVESKDLYEIDLHDFETRMTWKKITKPENTPIGQRTIASRTYPGKLWGHSAEMSPAGNCMYIFGGMDNTRGNYCNDLWCYYISEKTWTFLPQTNLGPGIRYKHTSAMIKDQNKMLIFGGWDSMRLLQDLWEFDLKTKLWHEIKVCNTIPNIIPRCNHGMIIVENENHIQTNRLIIGSGWYKTSLRFSSHPFEQLVSFWELDLTKSEKKWRMIPSEIKDIYYAYSMFQFKGRIFLFGGRKRIVDPRNMHQTFGYQGDGFSQAFKFLQIPKRLYGSIDFDLRERLEYLINYYYDQDETSEMFRICVKGLLEDLNGPKILFL